MKMTTTIAIAGKGGSGKTTIAALLINLLSQKGTVLAIDADPATNLNLVLGLPLGDTVGKVREDMAARVKARIARTIEDAALQIIELVPEDRVIRGLEAEGTPLIELPLGSELQIAVLEIARKLELI